MIQSYKPNLRSFPVFEFGTIETFTFEDVTAHLRAGREFETYIFWLQGVQTRLHYCCPEQVEFMPFKKNRVNTGELLYQFFCF